jgi:hypothetical protein
MAAAAAAPLITAEPFQVLPHEYEELASRLANGGLDAIALAAQRAAHVGSHPLAGIRKCANLAVPAAASTSLAALFAQVSPGFGHHLHTWLPAALYAKGARCFVMTLRDPVARLQTAFKFENAVRWPPTGSVRLSSRAPGSKHEIGPEMWVRRFRGATLARVGRSAHEELSMVNATRRAYLAALPGNQQHFVTSGKGKARGGRWVRGPGHAMGEGNVFLVPQVSYLADFVFQWSGQNHRPPPPPRQSQQEEPPAPPTQHQHEEPFFEAGMGMDEPVSLHILCVNRLEEEWVRFLESYTGPRSRAVEARQVTRHAAEESLTGTNESGATLQAGTKWPWHLPHVNRRSTPLQ